MGGGRVSQLADVAQAGSGAGSSFGYVEIEQNPAERYERALLRAIYTATAKLDATIVAGGEWRIRQRQASVFGPCSG